MMPPAVRTRPMLVSFLLVICIVCIFFLISTRWTVDGQEGRASVLFLEEQRTAVSSTAATTSTVATTLVLLPDDPVPLAPEPPALPMEYAIEGIKKGPQNIFYLETSCVYDGSKVPPGGSIGGVTLQYRHACSVYSTAIRHPDRPVYLYHTCPLGWDYYHKSSEAVKRLLELKNVHIVPIDRNPEIWFKGTPLEGFDKKLKKSRFKSIHASDALRVLVLWKYGGQYLDLDVISLRNLTELGENWVGPERDRMLNNAIMNFGAQGPGHDLADNLLKEITKRFVPNGWYSIGPSLLSSVVSGRCKIGPKEKFSNVGRRSCGVMVYPKDIVFPLHPKIGPLFYKTEGWKYVREFLAKGYTLHYWNTSFKHLKVQEKSPFDTIAKAFCPLLYEAAKPNF